MTGVRTQTSRCQRSVGEYIHLGVGAVKEVFMEEVAFAQGFEKVG